MATAQCDIVNDQRRNFDVKANLLSKLDEAVVEACAAQHGPLPESAPFLVGIEGDGEVQFLPGLPLQPFRREGFERRAECDCGQGRGRLLRSLRLSGVSPPRRRGDVQPKRPARA